MAFSILHLPETRFAKTHGKYTEEDLDIEISHREPVTFSDKTAFFAVKCVRLAFDTGERGRCVHALSGHRFLLALSSRMGRRFHPTAALYLFSLPLFSHIVEFRIDHQR